jgi:hypothetical protein
VDIAAAGTLRCTFQETIGPFPKGYTADGRWLDAGGIVTAVWLAAPSATVER